MSQWNHVSVTYTNGYQALYVYGVLKNTGTQADFLGKTTAAVPLYLGSVGGDNYFNGLLDDFKIYNYARSPKQVVEDMNVGHPAPGSPVGSPLIYLKFDEGQGGTANNSCNGGSAKNGTMIAAARGSPNHCPCQASTSSPSTL